MQPLQNEKPNQRTASVKSQEHKETSSINAAVESTKRELAEENMYAFAKQVDSDYHKYFSEKYLKFNRVVDFVLPHEYIVRQYETFKETFPLSHCVYSTMVSSERYYVELVSIFRNNNAQMEGDLFEYHTSNNNDEDLSSIGMKEWDERIAMSYFCDDEHERELS